MMRRLLISLLALPFLFACNQNNPSFEEEPTEPTPSADFSSIDIQGHRGYRALYPENSVLGALKALEAGAHTIECDLAVSKDSVLVLSHEPWLNSKICQTADGTSPEEPGPENNLFAMTLEEISACDCGSLSREDFPRYQPVPHFKEPLDDLFIAVKEYEVETGNDVRFNIEIKSKPEWDVFFTPDISTFSDLLIEAVDKHGLAARVTIQSFDPRPLNYIHEIRPELTLSFLVWDPSTPVNKQLQALDFQPQVLSPNYKLVSKALIDSMHEKNIKVIPWTVNDSVEVLKLAKIGVDGIISDDPKMVVQTLR